MGGSQREVTVRWSGQLSMKDDFLVVWSAGRVMRVRWGGILSGLLGQGRRRSRRVEVMVREGVNPLCWQRSEVFQGWESGAEMHFCILFVFLWVIGHWDVTAKYTHGSYNKRKNINLSIRLSTKKAQVCLTWYIFDCNHINWRRRSMKEYRGADLWL